MSTDQEELFMELLESNKRILFKIINSYCRQPEERKDLEQEILVQLWNSIDKYDPDYKYATWMYRIALNVAISHYRKNIKIQSKNTSYSEDSLCFIKYEEYDAEPDDRLKLLQQYIERLDELNKALMLLYLDGKKHEEIAEILGISKTNVATRISRSIIKLKKEFQNIL